MTNPELNFSLQGACSSTDNSPHDLATRHEENKEQAVACSNTNTESTPLVDQSAGRLSIIPLLGNPNENKELVLACTDRSIGSIPSEEESTENDRIVPLLGKPYFTCVTSKSHIQAPYHLVVPKWFTHHLPSGHKKATLWYKNKTWEMRYGGDRWGRRFDSGWKIFSLENNLNIGDGLVVELMDEETLEFRVQILRGNVPDIGANLDDGQSSDIPILIN